MTTPALYAVESSYLKKQGYDPDDEMLYIVFHSGDKCYRYQNVTAEQYSDFLAAESQGKWFIANIKKNPEDHSCEAVG